jgi:GDPmannose 4,6-dehydratase
MGADGPDLHYQVGGEAAPDEICNVVAQSHIKVSLDNAAYTAHVDASGRFCFLELIRETRIETKLYHVSAGELFGKTQAILQTGRRCLTA